MPTPYDGTVNLWHVAGSWVGESTIAELAQTINTHAPNADGVFVKTSQGKDWQGKKDTKAEMAINSAADVAKWVATLSSFGLDFHAWSVPVGEDIDEEIEIIAEVCNVSGVKSMILDVEPFDDFWSGSRQDIYRLMTGIRQRIPDGFHIGMSVDPRSHWYDDIYPDAWRPYVQSIHPQVYWEFMEREAVDVLTETYVVWGAYGLPIYPVLQAWNVYQDSIREAQDIARGVRGATSLSYFRLGTIGPMQFPAIRDEFVDSETGPDNVTRFYDWEKIIAPDQSGFMHGTHTGAPVEEVFQEMDSVRGHKIKYKSTEPTRDKVWAQWNPRLTVEGTYEVSVYIPSTHATTKEAQYHIHGIKGAGTELLVRLNQDRYSNQWVPLVVYDFEAGTQGAQVNLTDLTHESGKEIAFGAVRWRRITEAPIPDDHDDDNPLSEQGFDPPIGTAEERMGSKVWPSTWFDATGFAVFYTAVGPAYHTGVDLNNNKPTWDSDRGTSVYAPAHGIVAFSGNLGGSWGHVIVIRHDPLPDGTVVWTRLAHVNNPEAIEGQRVERGERIADVGNAYGRQPYHLHYDIVKTDVVERTPGHWPGLSLTEVVKNYVHPLTFTKEHRPPGRDNG